MSHLALFYFLLISYSLDCASSLINSNSNHEEIMSNLMNHIRVE